MLFITPVSVREYYVQDPDFTPSKLVHQVEQCLLNQIMFFKTSGYGLKETQKVDS